MITRPLLAVAVEDFSTIRFPVLATPKLDGIRCLKVNDSVVTRNFKQFPNHYVREMLTELLPNGIDGEVMLKDVVNFNQIQSEVMSYEGKPKFIYNAFDLVTDSLAQPYQERIEVMRSWHSSNLDALHIQHEYLTDPYLCVDLILPHLIENEEQLLAYEQECLLAGYEGVMIRDPGGKYKCGRSTLKEGILLKIKQFNDAEAIVVGFEERQKNTNEQERNEFGLAKRSSKKDGMIGANTLGALLVRQEIETPEGKKTIEFGIGSGLDDELRAEVWNNKDKYLGKFVTYKFQPFGMKDIVPRFPIFKGFRSPEDMS